MEHIRQAIERAKVDRRRSASGGRAAGQLGDAKADHNAAKKPLPGQAPDPKDPLIAARQHFRTNRRQLQESRIIAQDGSDPRSTHYDMLRTQILRLMGDHGFKSLAITSPKLGCGKTLTSINLALSLARQSEGLVVLIDLDLRRPMVGRSFGIQVANGIDDVVARRCRLADVLLVPDLCDQRLRLLPVPKPVANPTELLVSSTMKRIISDLKNDVRNHILIFDLPPMLSSDDFLAFVPQADCALVVAAVGQSTIHEISECERLMPEGVFLGCVLNKANQTDTTYGSYGYS